MDWFKIATEWVELSRSLSHGQVEARMVEFAKGHGLTPVSVRRAAAALRFAEQALGAGIVGSVAELATVRLENLDALKRMSAYGMENVRGIVGAVTDGSLRGAALREKERLFRQDEAARVPRGKDNALELRLRAPAFRAAALAAIAERACRRGEVLLVLEPGARDLAPLAVDALSRAANGIYRGYRLIPAAASGREARMSDAVVLGLAGARVFDAFELVPQSGEDASLLTAKVREVGPCGVGVSWVGLGPRTRLTERVAASRQGAPDLRPRYEDLLAALWAGDAGEGRGRPPDVPVARSRA